MIWTAVVAMASFVVLWEGVRFIILMVTLNS